MTQMLGGFQFYDALPKVSAFAALTEDTQYHDVPKDWVIGVADIVNSTGEVSAGRYKTVNMVGAAVISALMNGLKGRPFPFVFGGDGASFVLPPEAYDMAQTTMSQVIRWAEDEFEISLRAALIPVSEAMQAGQRVRIARFKASEGVDYAMFSGGGLIWAEGQMKSGQGLIESAPPGATPDLTGLSCRWAHMPTRQGVILSLVVAPVPGAKRDDVARVYRLIVETAEALDRAGHPAEEQGMAAKWPPAGAKLEAQASKGSGSRTLAHAKALFESFVAWALIRTGWSVAGFDARRYARIVAQNADFRKLDDGLKMTLDCDAATKAELERILATAADAGIVRYGTSTQTEAMMTCIVPSIMTDDHLHFIDGASGGYTKAATEMKRTNG